ILRGIRQPGELYPQLPTETVALRDRFRTSIRGVGCGRHLTPNLESRAVLVQGLDGIGAVRHGYRGSAKREDQPYPDNERERERDGADGHSHAGADEGVVFHRDGERRTAGRWPR